MIGKKTLTEEEEFAAIENLINHNPHLKVLLKQGEHGSTLFYKDNDKIIEIHKPAFKFEDYPGLSLVDTTGAGDCFSAAFAV